MMSYQENTHIYHLIQDTFKARPEDIVKSLEAAEKRREYNRKYKEKYISKPENKEKAGECVREWQRNNRAHLAAKHKARYENDP
jgi:F0F1-type ATP synthase membrane subunit b/b'